MRLSEAVFPRQLSRESISPGEFCREDSPQNLAIQISPGLGKEFSTIFTISNQAEIPATELPRVFEKFYRVPKADRWKQGGTGLGLALVQKLVERLQGTISVDSSDGWTTFTIELFQLVSRLLNIRTKYMCIIFNVLYCNFLVRITSLFIVTQK